jgi:DNA topoisomerase-1
LSRPSRTTTSLVLATDPDREGEAISWHLLEVLTKKGALKGKTVQRVAFNAITKSAVQEAIAHPRDVDMALVDAYLARRALDYLVGFTISPVLWRKLPGARSAGRVQSVALAPGVRPRTGDRSLPRPGILVNRWHLRHAAGRFFRGRPCAIDGKRLEKLSLGTGDTANAILAAIKGQPFAVDLIESKPVKRHPFPPFRTSTLQQEASRKLGFSASRTMQMAQKLYEGVDLKGETVGLITYMRTDGADMAPEAIAASRNAILKQFGEPYLPSCRASTPPRPRTPRKPTRPSAPPIRAARPTWSARHWSRSNSLSTT